MEKYQTQKTIRFGLTATNQNLYSEEIMKLLNVSEGKIKEQIKEVNNNTDKINQLRCCLAQIKEYLKTWNNIYSQINFLAITKDYYKIISKKARFDFDKGNGFEIKLSSLQSMYNNKKRYQYIMDFWKENLHKAENLYWKSDSLLKVFEEAKNQNRDDKKLNKVELRKAFLNLFNLVNESLKPLIEGNLFITNDDKIDEQNSKHKYVFDFILKTENRKRLYDSIGDLQNHFKDNGGYVPFGRATLNKWTAQQKSNHRDVEINKIIELLKIKTVSTENVDYGYNNFTNNFEQIKKNGKKIWNLKADAKSVIEVCQFFKYKKVPINARLSLAKRLIKENKLGKEKENIFLSEFGVSKSPALDYKNDTVTFSLSNYPLKVAFDYAWENCAKAKYEDISFPNEQCENYLKNVFGIDATKDKNGKLKNEHLDKYADLIRFKILLGRLKAEFYKTDEETNKNNIQELRNIFGDLDYYGDNRFNKNQIQEAVKAWFNNKEQNIGKKREDEILLTEDEKNNFSLSMQIIGQQRGGLKSQINKYKTLTDMFKVCASKFGKQFADLRDYFNEIYEVDKIKYRAWIIEDNKQNRFILFANKEKEIELEEEGGDLKFYEVKSLTSKSLVKFIKNRDAYKDFHSQNIFDSNTIKKDWKNYQVNSKFIKNLKLALINSKMAEDQNWSEFNFDFSKCNDYEQLEKEIDRKGYKLVMHSISEHTITNLVENKDCYLLPIVNQDINRENKQAENQNQFTKDWFDIFENKKRLHPEFNIFYRFPTKDYPNTKFKNGSEKTKRYSRFQMLVHFGLEVVPQGDYLSKKKQIAIFNDDTKQKEEVEKYNKNISSDFDYVIGIDRGIRQLATLCILDKNGVIQGDFKIYKRVFDSNKTKWKHELLSGEQNILDLSNLRVETAVEIDGKEKKEKVLVDLSKEEVEDKAGNRTKKENQQKRKLKELAYIRELQYAMQTRPNDLLDFVNKINSVNDITEGNIKNFISPYKEGENYADLPKEEIFNLLIEWKNADENERRKISELDPADNLKSGIVANMIGVVAHLCEKYNYKVYISLEDLTRAYGIQKDALNGTAIYQNDEDFKEQENLRLAGVGTYQFFEIQLLKKLFKVGQEKNILTVPAFRSVANYEKIVRRDKKNDKDEFVNHPFGIVNFVDPRNTSQQCPYCDNTSKSNKNGKRAFYRNKGIDKNSLQCDNCNLSTIKNKETKSDYHEKSQHLNLSFIQNGDENGAYHIALKAWKILQNRKKN